jgi:hypothetical protein
MAGKQIYKPIDDLDAKMWRAYRHSYICLENNNLARYDKLGNRILMKMSYEEWKNIWIQSGKWHERGKKAGQYVMTRIDDVGHYEVNNVRITTIGDNVREAHIGTKRSENTKKLMSQKRSGENHPLFGKHHKEESKILMSLARKGKKYPKQGVIQ